MLMRGVQVMSSQSEQVMTSQSELVCFTRFSTWDRPSTICKSDVMRVMRKQTLRSLSLSYQKKDGRMWPRTSFFWYGIDFSEFDSADIIDYILEKSVSCQKKDGRGNRTDLKGLFSRDACHMGPRQIIMTEVWIKTQIHHCLLWTKSGFKVWIWIGIQLKKLLIWIWIRTSLICK